MVQPTAHTELTIAFIRIIESMLCLQCLISHIDALKDVEPMPHIVIFCGTFGGFFILSLAKLVVPLSGQLSPPGVDLVFCFLGFILFYAAACVAMYYVQRDPHLIALNGQLPIVDEPTHPFFIRCVRHAVLSISTGTLFLMHTVISADRLTSILKGIEEDVERQIDEDDIDILPEDPISLHLFFYNWLIMLWNSVCCHSIRKLFRKCHILCIQYYRKKRPPSYVPRRRQHRKAVIMASDITRINGMTVSNIAPQEFIRNPRRTMAHNNVLASRRATLLINDETLEQVSSTQPNTRKERNLKTVGWDTSGSPATSIQFNANDKSPSKERSVSFIRNEAFQRDSDASEKSKKTNASKKPFKTADKENDLDKSPSKERSVSFIRNEAFERDSDVSEKSKKTNASKKPFKTADKANDLDKAPPKERSESIGAEGESKIKKISNWFSRTAETVVQNVPIISNQSIASSSNAAPDSGNNKESTTLEIEDSSTPKITSENQSKINENKLGSFTSENFARNKESQKTNPVIIEKALPSTSSKGVAGPSSGTKTTDAENALSSTSYVQSVVRLIPSDSDTRNPTSSGKEHKKKSTDDTKNKK